MNNEQNIDNNNINEQETSMNEKNFDELANEMSFNNEKYTAEEIEKAIYRKERREYFNKQWRAKNPEKVKAYMKKYNKERNASDKDKIAYARKMGYNI